MLERSSLPQYLRVCGHKAAEDHGLLGGFLGRPSEGAVVLRQEGWMEQVWTRGLGPSWKALSRSGCCKEYHSP